MKTRRTIAVSLAVGMFLALTAVGKGNLISNGGFETPGGDKVTPTGWAKDGGSYGTYDGTGHTPKTHGGSWVYVPGNGAATTVGVYQTLGAPLAAGNQYTLDFWSTPWFAGTGNDVRVGDYSGSGTLDNVANWTSLALNVVDIPTVAPHSWQLRSYTFTAAGGEDTVYFGTAIAGNNNGADIDDVSLLRIGGPENDIPEPVTMALVGLAVAGLGRYVRRRGRT